MNFPAPVHSWAAATSAAVELRIRVDLNSTCKEVPPTPAHSLCFLIFVFRNFVTFPAAFHPSLHSHQHHHLLPRPPPHPPPRHSHSHTVSLFTQAAAAVEMEGAFAIATVLLPLLILQLPPSTPRQQQQQQHKEHTWATAVGLISNCSAPNTEQIPPG